MSRVSVLLSIIAALMITQLRAQGLPKSPVAVNSSLYGRLKVQRYYWINLHVIDSANMKVYRAGDKTVSYSLYNEIKDNNERNSISDCVPCFLEVYDLSGKLMRKSVSYTDCPVGKEITYFPSGKVKSIGYWREKTSVSWKEFKCGLTGDWLYYNEDGNIVKVECHDADKPY